MDHFRLFESLNAFLGGARPSSGPITLTIQVGSDPRDALTVPLTDKHANDLDWALLAARCRGRCLECGQVSPDDDPLEPGSGYLCLDCGG